MNQTLIKIYILIMLECRIPLVEASKIFRIPAETLQREIESKVLHELYRQPLEYLELECSRYPEGLAKGKWKATVYLRRLQNILKVQDKEEKVRLLNEFITALAGPDISFAINKRSYTPEEKIAIIKYRLKYAVSATTMKNNYCIDFATFTRWEQELPEGELKIRFNILREYLADKDVISKKRYLKKVRNQNE